MGIQRLSRTAPSIPAFETYKKHLSPSLTKGTIGLSGTAYVAKIIENIGEILSATLRKIKTLATEGRLVTQQSLQDQIDETIDFHEKHLNPTVTLKTLSILEKDIKKALTTLKLTRTWINHFAELEGINTPTIHKLINKTEKLSDKAKGILEKLISFKERLQIQQLKAAEPHTPLAPELKEIKQFFDQQLTPLILDNHSSPIMIQQIVHSLNSRLDFLTEEPGTDKAAIHFLKNQLASIVIPENPKPAKAPKPPKVLQDQDIRQHNRREVPAPQVPGKLRTSFDESQEYLDVEKNPYWHLAYDRISLKSVPEKTLREELPPTLALKTGISYVQGRRPTMEDAHIATTLKVDVKGTSNSVPVPLFGIFDGHGGDKCSDFIEKHLPEYLKRELSQALADPDKDAAIFNLLKKTFVELGDLYKIAHPYAQAGSTATIALVIGRNLWVANVGDTRAVISSNGIPIALSEDAKPSIEKYRRGAEKRGGSVIFYGVSRVVKRERGALAMGRGVGHDEIDSGVNPRAKVVKYNLDNLPPGLQFLVIGCDGLWDVASSTQVAKTISECEKVGQTPTQMSSTLVSKAYGAGSTDNISALVVDLSALNLTH